MEHSETITGKATHVFICVPHPVTSTPLKLSSEQFVTISNTLKSAKILLTHSNTVNSANTHFYITTKPGAEGKRANLRPVAGRKLRNRIREYQTKSTMMVRAANGAGEKGSIRVKRLWASQASALPACMYSPHCCWTMGSWSTWTTHVLFMGDFQLAAGILLVAGSISGLAPLSLWQRQP